MMPRSVAPSRAQVQMLIEFLETRHWMATGFHRTSHARDRLRVAWEEIAGKLNSDGSGCIKTWQQWSKYWKDKKSAVRKKASQLRMAMRQTGGGALDPDARLSEIDERIVAIMGGDSFYAGDRELETNLIHVPANEPEPTIPLSVDGSEAIPEATSTRLMNVDFTEEITASASHESESILQSHGQHQFEIGMLQTEQSTSSIPDVQPGPSRHRDNIHMENQPNLGQMSGARSPHAMPSNAPNNSSTTPRRRRMIQARRRLIRRSPPAQRQSQMASLTERFVALEEKRIENERRIVENQDKMLEIFKEISESWSRQTQALLDLCTSIRRGNIT